MQLVIFPKYQDLFPGREVPTLDEVLAKSSSKTLLKAFAFMNAKVHFRPDDLSSQEQIFWEWIGIFPEGNSIGHHYLTFRDKILQEGNAVTLFAPNALLRLIEYVTRHFNDLPEKPLKDVDDEMALLEAWLVNNATFDLEVAEGIKPELGNLSSVILVNEAAQYEFSKRKDFIYQTFLGQALFEFLSNDARLQPYLQEFLNHKHVSTYNEYLLHLVGVYMDAFDENSFGFQVAEDNIEAAAFFDTIALDLASDPFKNMTDQPDPDFKLLRTKPFIKTEDGGYYPLHLNFIVDKMYQGVSFDFYQNTSVNQRFKSFGTLLQFLGQEFAESHLFYKHIAGCFLPKKYVVTVQGDQYSKVEYSDFYVREGNTFFLFEFKNNIMNAQIKQSKSSAKIGAEINKKLVFNPDNKKDKGVGQLFKVIQKIATGGFDFDNLSDKKLGRLQIYPIIVHTDDFFALDSIQDLVNTEFKVLLQKNPIVRHQVHEVTLMHLQDIVDIQSTVQSGQSTFKSIMKEYFIKRKIMTKKKPRSHQELLDKYVGFRPLVQHIIKPYADHQGLLGRMSAALGLESNP